MSTVRKATRGTPATINGEVHTLDHFFQHSIATWAAIDAAGCTSHKDSRFRYCLYHVTPIDDFIANYANSKGDLQNLAKKTFASSWDRECGGELGSGLYTSTFEGAMSYAKEAHKTVILEIDVGDHLGRTVIEVPTMFTSCRNCTAGELPDPACIAELDATSFCLTNEKSVKMLYARGSESIPQLKLTWSALQKSIPFRVVFWSGFRVSPRRRSVGSVGSTRAQRGGKGKLIKAKPSVQQQQQQQQHGRPRKPA
jgi:hypothetical protein